jgi:hypothetical protein
MSNIYQVVKQSRKLLEEIEVWTDVAITSQMRDWPTDLGGYVPDPIPPRFEELVKAYNKGETTYSECVLSIGKHYLN